ncbi:unnamed protein product [Ostreobium quekettii]|uniref:Uncharacterized protein n=1 Tax=Ostreobium quekettii TaxID=121088 RepID=A0A8S1J2C3_9CHLO|nr:unnamed protein product [Ostreobium quekettii]|eukprot:evm.model.scf_460.4 EVM.evm.TU.scf_460.4   scf_460:59248-62114(+)
MFNNQNVGERGVSRPFIVALILLLLFLSTTQDWGKAPSGGKKPEGTGAKGGAVVSERVKEKIIYDLSVQNEKLERENARLRQQVLDTRRAFRACTRGENGTAILEGAGWPLEEDPLALNETLPGDGDGDGHGDGDRAAVGDGDPAR